MEFSDPPPLSPQDEALALLISMTIRNAMEDFHVDHLTDSQMAQLNPIIRNAVATALHAWSNAHVHAAARDHLRFQEMLVPDYWEAPELLQEYREMWKRIPEDDIRCRTCDRRIIDVGRPDAPHWTHIAADGGTNVGCRAASFSRQAGWDDTIDRRSSARP